MKKIYSTILLLSFLVGALQPILPMIEYHLFEGDLISMFDSTFAEQDSFEEALCVAFDTDIPADQREEDFSLLDIDYYPIPLKCSEVSGMMILPTEAENYIFVLTSLVNNFRDTSPPPPKEA